MQVSYTILNLYDLIYSRKWGSRY